MRSGIKVAKLFGINIYIDPSWIFIFLLVTWNLAVGVFPDLHPGWSSSLTWAVSLVASLLFFASVVAHELAHSIVARANGIPVKNITLFLFGGVSNIQREPPSPMAEFVMAIVGPLTSIVLGIIFVLLAGARTPGLGLGITNGGFSLAGLDPISTLLLWLGPINIILGIFNLIPGFPLDGGRVLRSIIWASTHNLRTATRWASWVGQAIALIMIVAGISMIFGISIPFFGEGIIGGIWLAVIGWFLNNAAVESYRQVVVHDILEGIPVSTLMRSNANVVSPDTTIESLVHEYIMRTDEEAFPVVEADRLLGLVSLEDVRKVPRAEWDKTIVRQIMTPVTQLAVATPREDASDALSDLANKDMRGMPVVQDGRLVGMLRRNDIIKWLQLHSEAATR